MAASNDEGPRRSYKLVSAIFRDRAYSGGTLLFYEAQKEIEFRQRTGRGKEEVVVARFRVEPEADVKSEGAVLKISELSLTLESPEAAGEVAGILRPPLKERQDLKQLAEAESLISKFLVTREEAVNLLLRTKTDPRSALLGDESVWASDDTTDPLDAVYSSYSARLTESFDQMSSFLEGAEGKLGSDTTERLYALTYTVGVVQNALFEAGSDLANEIAALQELGVTTTAEDLRMEKLVEPLMAKAHPALEAFATAHPAR